LHYGRDCVAALASLVTVPLGALAAEAMADAVVHAATQATGIAGIPAARDLKR